MRYISRVPAFSSHLYPLRAALVVVAAGFAGVVVVACDGVVAEGEGDGEGEGEAGEGEGEGEGEVVLDSDQVRRGTAELDDSGFVVDDDALPHPPAGIVVYDLGALAVDEHGVTGSVFVDVDDRVTGVTFVAYGSEHVILWRAEDGAGDVIVDDVPVAADTPGFAQVNGLSSGFPAQFLSPGRVLPARHAGAFLLPSSPDIALAAGTWSARFGHFVVDVDDAGDPVVTPASGPVRVLALVRTTAVAPGRLPFAFHFTGAGGLTAETAQTSTALADAVTLLRESFAAVGVDASDVSYDDLEDGAAFSTIVLDEPRCEGGDLDEVVTHGVADRVNIFFVDRFECGPFGPFLLGLSPGIPGVPYAKATPRSGVVVATSFLTSDPSNFALVLAHETAHFMGLYHSQENDRFSDVDVYDNVSDTGEDAAARDNLMFFDVSRIDERVLSPLQGVLMQTNPWVLP